MDQAFAYLKLIIVSLWFVLTTQLVLSQQTLTDAEGNVYPVITIGDQLWMAENLRVTCKSNGMKIESFCFYNDTSYARIYGRLYSWNTMMDGSRLEGAQGICPNGWHIPTDNDWEKLVNAQGGYKIAGKNLRTSKENDFRLQFGGNFHPVTKVFSYIDRESYYWTSTEYNINTSWMRNIGARKINVNRSTVEKEYCFSVRCVKDK